MREPSVPDALSKKIIRPMYRSYIMDVSALDVPFIRPDCRMEPHETSDTAQTVMRTAAGRECFIEFYLLII